jgi:hypothetical protein
MSEFDPTEHETVFPCIFVRLEVGDMNWENGARFRVDTVDRELYFFGRSERAIQFMEDHGMRAVTSEQMMDLRREAGLL